MCRAALTVLAIALVAMGAAGVVLPAPAEGSSHSAIRSFSSPWTPPGGELHVTVAVTGHAGIGQVVETLPEGFRYDSSDLLDDAVEVRGQTVSFSLVGDDSVTYTVTAPAAQGSYSFSGVLKNIDLEEVEVGGAAQVRVGPAPTPGPTPPSTVTAMGTPGPGPTPTTLPGATQRPTLAASTPTPAATATPRSAPRPTLAIIIRLTPDPTATRPAPTAAPTATPVPTLVPAATATPAAPLTPAEEGSGNGAVIVVAVLVLVVVAVFALFLALAISRGRRR